MPTGDDVCWGSKNSGLYFDQVYYSDPGYIGWAITCLEKGTATGWVKRLAEFGLRHGLTSDTTTPVMPKDELLLRTGLMFGSEFFVDTQLPGPTELKYTAVRVLPPSPLRHVTHAKPFAL